MVVCYNHEPIWIHHNQGPPRLHQGSFSGIHLMGLTLWKHRVFHCSKNPLCSTYSVLVVQLLSRVQLFAIPWTSARQDSLSFTISLSLLKLMSIESVIPSNHLILCCHLLSCPQSFPASESFPMSQLVASVAKVLELQLQHQSFPMNIQDWFPLRLTGLISLLSKGFSRVFASTIVWKHQFFGTQHSLWSNSHICTWVL